MPAFPVDAVAVGRIAGVYGIRGWVKIHSATAPQENIFDYQPWWIRTRSGWQALEIVERRRQGRGLVARIAGIDDRDRAQEICQQDILVSRSQFSTLSPGEFYWSELLGLTVYSEFGETRVRLGKVVGFMETGANDVLLVRGYATSCDRRERLIPYVDQYVIHTDLDGGEMIVAWDPAF